MKNANLVLRLLIVMVLLTHGVPGMVNGDVNDFGRLYLDKQGFAPFGVPLAWAIKISHVACAVLLLLNRCVITACLVFMAILVAGIIMVHFPEGWYVVGGGRNGMEYNVVLIGVLVAIVLSRDQPPKPSHQTS